MSEENTLPVADELSAPEKSRRSIDKPVLTALVILLATICFFVVWKLFFDTGLKGDWRLQFKRDGKEYSYYGLTFKDGNVFDYSFGGVTYTGQYTLSPDDATLHISSSSYGKYNIHTDFKYSTSGNAFGGRKLVLAPSEETELSFVSSGKYEPVVQKYKDFKADKNLLGTWLYKDETQGYNYTFTFYDNGEYEYLCSGSRHVGAYQAENGTFTYNLAVDGGVVNEESFPYSVKDGKLTLSTDNFTDVLTKTDNKYSFENKTN